MDEVEGVLKIYYETECMSMCPGLAVFSSMIWCLCRCGKVDDTEVFEDYVIYVKFLLLSFKQIRILTHQLAFIIWLCILEIKKGGSEVVDIPSLQHRNCIESKLLGPCLISEYHFIAECKNFQTDISVEAIMSYIYFFLSDTTWLPEID
ncbi:hypothetical protein MtrunA17_Chr1g0170911 [Medicago truncatula]|uniref:Uncharacterized protein n=1 Tax=Medicago truncatula TaxID=3880 RepID=A0A396JRH0_MEDTR|nr:hypothetical protein MtrunA17_Chr1g0170911 [Medicago truncatula]